MFPRKVHSICRIDVSTRYSEGVLELAILGLLKEQDLHGYELKKRLGETLGVTSGVSFGSLYPALGRLERAGAVRSVEASARAEPAPTRAPIPQTGSLGGELAAWRARSAATRAGASRSGGARAGRSRKVYGITAHGEEVFEELLAAEQSSGDDSRLFHLRLAFAGYLSAEARLGMLERRRAHLLDRLTRAGAGTRTGRRIDSYVRSLMEHDRESTQHDLSWIERLIDLERDAGARSPAAAPWPAPSPAAPSPAAPPAATSPEPRPSARPTPARAITPPTLSGFRPVTPETGRPARTNQEESIR
jgi:DNA-binding PadR family transcriptional regulator